MINDDTFRGVVHGSTVKLSSLPEVLDGVEVDVVIKRLKLTAEQRSEKLRELFGSCKDDAAELDAFDKWNANQRKQNRSGEQL